MSFYRTKPITMPPAGPSELELLKSSHKFLREDDTEPGKDQTWEDKLAAKYYSSLYREFAVCDLKHYKSGNFALRWRTEAEVLSGAGESSCGNTRCSRHAPNERASSLTTLELPFAYEEHGEAKTALVKIVLCTKCLDKMMWKRRQERAEREGQRTNDGDNDEGKPSTRRESQRSRDRDAHRHRHRRSASPRRRE